MDEKSVVGHLRRFFDHRDLPTRPQLGGMLIVLFLVGYARAFHFERVFRGTDIILLGNDPWAVRTTVDQLVAQATGWGDMGTLLTAETRDPLFTLVLSLASEIVGGTTAATGTVLALYPLVAGLVIAGILYRIAWELTEDRWVSITVVLLLAITPGHAIRSSVGFADHHVFDQVWIALTMLSLMLLSTDEPDRKSTVLGIGLLGAGLAGQVVSWLGGIIYIVPIGLFVFTRVVSGFRAETSPFRENLPIGLGALLGSLVVLLSHFGFGWHTVSIAFVPLLLVGAIGLLIALGEFCRSRNYSIVTLAEVGLVLVVVYAFLALSIFPNIDELLTEGLGYFNQPITAVEAQSIFAGEYGLLIGPFIVFGLLLYFAFPYLLLSSWNVYRRHDPVLLVIVIYAWFFLGLSIVQRRFAAELAIPVAVIAGLGVIDVADRLGVIHEIGLLSPESDRLAPIVRIKPSVSVKQAASLGLLLSVLVSTGFFQITLLSDEVVVEDGSYRSAKWMDRFSDRQELEYPSNFVLSHWGRNRMYNYIVTENARTEDYYRYSKGYFPEFIRSTNGEYWYQRLRGIPVGFVVLGAEREGYPENSLSNALYANDAGPTSNIGGFGHYRLRYTSETGSVKVYTLVPGAMVIGNASPHSSIAIETTVSLQDNPHDVVYRRVSETTRDGWWALRVPHPGEYQTPRGPVTVTEEAVNQGAVIGQRQRTAHWTFEESNGGVIFDRSGANHGWIRAASRTKGIAEDGLSLDGDSSAEIPDTAHLNGSDGFTVSTWFRLDQGVDYIDDVRFPRLVASAAGGPARNSDGFNLFLARRQIIGAFGNGSSATVLGGPEVTDTRWHQAVLTWDGQNASLYLDGTIVDSKYAGIGPSTQETITIGSSTDGLNTFEGRVDEVKFASKAINRSRIVAAFEAGRETCLTNYNRSACPVSTPEP